jgi:3-hydroxyisobutyrate dehydrogenase
MGEIAFLGTGTMGLPMCRNLARAGFDVLAWNRSRDRATPLADDGVTIAGSPTDAAGGRSVVITMLSDADAVLDTAATALPAAADGVCWLQMSTIGIAGIERCARLAEDVGATLVDAPVLGTREPAEAGRLVVLAAGPTGARGAAGPVFDVVGARTLWLGEDPGRASAEKVVINSWVVGVVGVLAETLTLSEGLGLEPQHFFEALEDGPLDLGYARLKGRAMIERAFDDPAFRLALSRKDAELVLAAGARVGLELPVLQAIAERLRRAELAGYGDLDMAATYLAEQPNRREAEHLTAP